VAGLDWIYTNRATLKPRIVNLSICSNALYSPANCDSSEPALATAVKNLVDAGIVVFAASGNRGSSTQMSAPACNTGVIAVGATYKSNQGRQPTLQEGNTFQDRWGTTFAACFDATTAFDKIACFTNSGPRLDILAPGAVVTSDFLGMSTDLFRGTSQASPAAAGVAALMLECQPSLTPAQVKDILQRTGVSIADTRNGQSYPSIRAFEAVRMACAGDASVVPIDAGRDAVSDARVTSDATLDGRADVSAASDGATRDARSDASDGASAGGASAVDASDASSGGAAGAGIGAGGTSVQTTTAATTSGTGAGVGTGPAGASTVAAGGAQATGPAGYDAGCSCRATGGTGPRSPWSLFAFAIVALVVREWRRRGSSTSGSAAQGSAMRKAAPSNRFRASASAIRTASQP
jgi:hypothetical protein